MSDLFQKSSGIASIHLRKGQREELHRTVILAVGEIGLWNVAGRLLQGSSDLAYSEFSNVDAELMATLAPDIVVSPMMTRSFDCLDLSQLLASIGFTGRYRILTKDVPNPRMILSEIASICPGLDADVIVLSQLESPGLH